MHAPRACAPPASAARGREPRLLGLFDFLAAGVDGLGGGVARRGVAHHQDRERQQQDPAAHIQQAHVGGLVVRHVADQQARKRGDRHVQQEADGHVVGLVSGRRLPQSPPRTTIVRSGTASAYLLLIHRFKISSPRFLIYANMTARFSASFSSCAILTCSASSTCIFFAGSYLGKFICLNILPT